MPCDLSMGFTHAVRQDVTRLARAGLCNVQRQACWLLGAAHAVFVPCIAGVG